MKIFISQREYVYYDGSEIIGVFTNKEAAKKCCKDDKPQDMGVTHDIEEYELQDTYIRVCEYCDGELVHIMLDDETYTKCVECERINYYVVRRKSSCLTAAESTLRFIKRFNV